MIELAASDVHRSPDDPPGQVLSQPSHELRPSSTVRLITPTHFAGASPDIIARLFAEKLDALEGAASSSTIVQEPTA